MPTLKPDELPLLMADTVASGRLEHATRCQD